MSLSQKVAFNTVVQIASKATTVVFGLLTTILLTGYLGRDGFGDYMYVITLVVMFGAFADWGTMTIGVREAARDKKNQGRIFGNILLIRFGLALIAAALMILAAFFLPLETKDPVMLRRAMAIGSIILVLFATKATFGMIFQTRLVMQRLAAADLIASFLILLISWFLIRQQVGLLPLIGAVGAANVVAVLVALVLAKKIIKFDFQLDKVFIKKLLKESLPMGAILLMFTVDNKIDTVMLGAIKGSGAVGIYAVAYRVYDVLILGAHYLMITLLPVLSHYAARNQLAGRTKLKQIYQKAFDVLLLMGGGVFFATWFLAPLMVRVITQQRWLEFADSILVLRILALALFLAYFNHLTGYTIVALGRQRRYLLVSMAALSFNVVANLILIPRLSYYGAATVTILTEALVLVITTLIIFRIFKMVPSIIQFPKTAVDLVRKRGKIF